MDWILFYRYYYKKGIHFKIADDFRYGFSPLLGKYWMEWLWSVYCVQLQLHCLHLIQINKNTQRGCCTDFFLLKIYSICTVEWFNLISYSRSMRTLVKFVLKIWNVRKPQTYVCRYNIYKTWMFLECLHASKDVAISIGKSKIE